ncbi:predicted protein [Micromonas commoda]|uniref:Uncharacterized protein n=1 Tax=Micromonas commoda (strain RCC299 / NOUM17 / CCMP2709) TaxID=296587 RepID=C1EG76_MICCC|nr:predicted protein [Micromonas commoda]ACO66974.1 predicted protein [Micromonas commoda]|eukprot:XP_002505716.1 predicted protein [Micromonas commoda]
MGIQGVPIAPEAGFGGKYLPGGPPAMPGMPLGGPPPEVLVSPEHMAAYAANCRRTLHYAVNGTLLAKRDHIQHQIGRLRARMLEVAHVKGVMEREIQNEASEALQRLESSESLKMMRIQREVDELARHADAINTLASEVDAVTSAPDAHTAEFLGRYRAMYDACDRLARRPLPEPADVDASDFEREARLYTAAVKERDALSRLLEVKDNMIWSLLDQRREMQEEIDNLKSQKAGLFGGGYAAPGESEGEEEEEPPIEGEGEEQPEERSNEGEEGAEPPATGEEEGAPEPPPEEA